MSPRLLGNWNYCVSNYNLLPQYYRPDTTNAVYGPLGSAVQNTAGSLCSYLVLKVAKVVE